jgi:hypothetical protein
VANDTSTGKREQNKNAASASKHDSSVRNLAEQPIRTSAAITKKTPSHRNANSTAQSDSAMPKAQQSDFVERVISPNVQGERPEPAAADDV